MRIHSRFPCLLAQRLSGDLIHFDIKRLARIVKPGHRVHGDRTRETRGAGYEYLHIVIDDHTRLAFAAILPDQTHASARKNCGGGTSRRLE